MARAYEEIRKTSLRNFLPSQKIFLSNVLGCKRCLIAKNLHQLQPNTFFGSEKNHMRTQTRTWKPRKNKVVSPGHWAFGWPASAVFSLSTISYCTQQKEETQRKALLYAISHISYTILTSCDWCAYFSSAVPASPSFINPTQCTFFPPPTAISLHIVHISRFGW